MRRYELRNLKNFELASLISLEIYCKINQRCRLQKQENILILMIKRIHLFNLKHRNDNTFLQSSKTMW